MNEDLLQYALVGDLLQGGIPREKTRELIKQHGFKPDYVTVPELRTAYDILIGEKTNDVTLLREAVVGKLSNETLEKAASRASDMAPDIERHVLGVKDAGIKAKAREMFEEKMRLNATGEFVLSDLARGFGDFSRDVMCKAKSGGYSLKGVVLPPEEDDPDCLFRGGFLEKGGALVLGSVAGAGKSTLLMQLVFAWSLGRPALGITPLRPLKIGIFQSENSLRDMMRIADGVRGGYVRFGEGWTDGDCDTALERIIFFNAEGKTDDEFLDLLYKEQLAWQFDLVVIDPLTGFATFDISDNTKMNDYLTKKIDPIIKHDPATKCGLMIIHHTNKMSAANALEYAADQFAQYICAGAAKLPNWARGVIGVMPTKNKAGHYYFVVSKRGEQRLDWPKLMLGNKEVKFPTKIIRHSTSEEDAMFWHEVDATTAPSVQTEKPCVTKDAARLADVLQTDAMTLTEARKFAVEMFKCKRGNAAYDEMMANPSEYNVVEKPTGRANQSIVGSVESVEKYFSKLQEKEAAKMRAKLAKIDAGK